jgi:hypothetical protein
MTDYKQKLLYLKAFMAGIFAIIVFSIAIFLEIVLRIFLLK